MRTHIGLAAGFLVLSTVACSAEPEERVAQDDADYSTASARLAEACLRALPEGPEFQGAYGHGETTGAPLSASAAAVLAERPELARAFIEVFKVSCSTHTYDPYETPYCARSTHYEEINTNYSPRYLIERGESYRNVKVRLTAEGTLSLETGISPYSSFKPTFATSGSYDDLHVRMSPPQGWTLPEDLAAIDSYGKLDFDGRLVEGELFLAHTNAPVVSFNYVSCGRAVIRTSFDMPAANAPAASE